MTDDLRDEGFKVSRPRVARLMKKHGIRAQTKRKFKVTTDSDHDYPLSPNRLDRDFSADRFGAVWTSDITYIRTGEGWLYLTVVMDLFNREIVGWAMSESLRASETTIPALRAACMRYRPLPGLIFHSDRGVQYACEDFRELIFDHQMLQSMSGTGDCYDNAVTETAGNAEKGTGLPPEIQNTLASKTVNFSVYRNILQQNQKTLNTGQFIAHSIQRRKAA